MNYLLCNDKETSKSFVENPSLNLLEKVLSGPRERAKYRDSTLLNFVERTKGVTAVELLKSKCRYQESYYANFTNIGKLPRVKFFLLLLLILVTITIKRKSGKLSLSSLKEKELETVRTRSKSTLFNKTLYIICQKPGGEVYKVQKKDLDGKILSVSENLDEKFFYMHLNAIPSIDDDTFFFLPGFSLTNIHEPQDRKGRERVHLQLLTTTSNSLTEHLDISRKITAESSPLHIASSRTRTRNLWFPSASH